jgi:hypothetical protein
VASGWRSQQRELLTRYWKPTQNVMMQRRAASAVLEPAAAENAAHGGEAKPELSCGQL